MYRRGEFKSRVAALGMALAPVLALAQAAPDAGSILRDIQKSTDYRPSHTLPPVSFPGEQAPPDSGFKVFVHGFRISRAKLFPEAELQALLADFVGKELGFAQLQKAALKIGEHYRQHGYFARAFLPRQQIENGIVEIVVLEGKLGEVEIDKSSQSRLDAEIARESILARQPRGAALRPDEIQRGLRILGETPGVQVSATMEPGKQEGDTNLILKLQDGPLLSGMGMLDNQGVQTTGEYRLTGTLAVNNPSGQGDQLSLMGLASANNEFVRAGYSFRVGYDGLRLGVNASTLGYKLGGSFANLNANGSARTYGASATYPFVRSAGFNLFGAATFDKKQFINNANFANTNDKAVDVVAFTLSGDKQEDVLGVAMNQFSLSLLSGRADLGHNAADLAADQASARTQGGYLKLAYTLTRLQKLIDQTGLFVNLTGQFAGRNLDSSEKFSLGGPNGIRAYPSGDGTGDEGWMLNAEVRQSLDDELQLVGFLDAGGVTQHKRPWTAWNAANPRLPNRYDLAGAGVGVNFTKAGDFAVKATLATRIGKNPGRDANGNDSDGGKRGFRFWIQAVKFF